MKIFKWKALNLAVIVVLAALILSTFVYSINNIDELPQSTEPKDNSTIQPSEKLKPEKNKQEIKKDLSREDILKLYNQGYSLIDIQKAELLSAKCDLSPEEILNKKGKKDYKVTKRASRESDIEDNSQHKDTKEILDDISKEKDHTKDYVVEDQSKSWKEVEKELFIESTLDNGGDQ